MTKCLVDTNIFLDVFLERETFFDTSSAVIDSIENGAVTGVIASHSITTIYYFLKKTLSHSDTLKVITDILNIFEVGELTHKVFVSAQKLGFNDYEDALICEIAHREGCDVIITRNISDFRGSIVPVATPEGWNLAI